MRNNKIKLKPIAQKILLLLLAGVALGLTRSPRQYFRILKDVKKDWERIDRYALHRTIKRLYKSGLIETRDNPDGSTTIVLSKSGKEVALTYQIDEMEIHKMPRWDGKWRIIIFDVPENRKRARDALSRKLKQLGFYQFQKSVFVHPFECQNEIDFIREFFKVGPYVKYIMAEEIENQSFLKKHFGLK